MEDPLDAAFDAQMLQDQASSSGNICANAIVTSHVPETPQHDHVSLIVNAQALTLTLTLTLIVDARVMDEISLDTVEGSETITEVPSIHHTTHRNQTNPSTPPPHHTTTTTTIITVTTITTTLQS